MRNQPKYSFKKNTRYALKGIKDLIKNEVSFKLEIIFISMLTIILLCIDNISLTNKIIMFITLYNILLCEAINSAIERVVDLVTLEYHEMAARAKDMGSAIVFLSIVICLFAWGIIIFNIN